MEELDAGLDLKTLGSRPEPKADAQQLSHPGAPKKQLSVEVRNWWLPEGREGRERVKYVMGSKLITTSTEKCTEVLNCRASGWLSWLSV